MGSGRSVAEDEVPRSSGDSSSPRGIRNWCPESASIGFGRAIKFGTTTARQFASPKEKRPKHRCLRRFRLAGGP